MTTPAPAALDTLTFQLREVAAGYGSMPAVTLNKVADAISALRAQVETLTAALAPFAKAAPKYHKCRDDRPLAMCWEADKETLTVGDLRRARSAEPQPPGDGT